MYHNTNPPQHKHSTLFAPAPILFSTSFPLVLCSCLLFTFLIPFSLLLALFSSPPPPPLLPPWVFSPTSPPPPPPPPPFYHPFPPPFPPPPLSPTPPVLVEQKINKTIHYSDSSYGKSSSLSTYQFPPRIRLPCWFCQSPCRLLTRLDPTSLGGLLVALVPAAAIGAAGWPGWGRGPGAAPGRPSDRNRRRSGPPATSSRRSRRHGPGESISRRDRGVG